MSFKYDEKYYRKYSQKRLKKKILDDIKALREDDELHLVILVDDFVSQKYLDHDRITSKMPFRDNIVKYKGTGKSARGNKPHNPYMLLKILLISFFEGNTASRKIEENLQENYQYIYLSGNTYMTRTSLCYYRSQFFDGIYEEVVKEFAAHLIDMGIYDPLERFRKGYKFRANNFQTASKTEDEIEEIKTLTKEKIEYRFSRKILK